MQRDGIIKTALGTSLKFVKERALSPWSKTSKSTVPQLCVLKDCFVQGVQHHHGSQLLAAVMDRGTILMWQCSSSFCSDAHASVRASGVENEGSCRTTRAIPPMVVGLDSRQESVMGR